MLIKTKRNKKNNIISEDIANLLVHNEITINDITNLLIYPENLHIIDLDDPQKHMATIKAYESLENMEDSAKKTMGGKQYLRLKGVLYDFFKDLGKKETAKYIVGYMYKLKLEKRSQELTDTKLCVLMHMINKAQNKY